MPAAANNLSGTSKQLLVENGAGVLMYEDDVVSKEIKSVSRTPFADPTFLHAIGSTFLERVARNSPSYPQKVDEEDEDEEDVNN